VFKLNSYTASRSEQLHSSAARHHNSTAQQLDNSTAQHRNKLTQARATRVKNRPGATLLAACCEATHPRRLRSLRAKPFWSYTPKASEVIERKAVLKLLVLKLLVLKLLTHAVLKLLHSRVLCIFATRNCIGALYTIVDTNNDRPLGPTGICKPSFSPNVNRPPGLTGMCKPSFRQRGKNFKNTREYTADEIDT
jgi:hypothetical protein